MDKYIYCAESYTDRLGRLATEYRIYERVVKDGATLFEYRIGTAESQICADAIVEALNFTYTVQTRSWHGRRT